MAFLGWGGSGVYVAESGRRGGDRDESGYVVGVPGNGPSREQLRFALDVLRSSVGDGPQGACPTMSEFAPRFMNEYVRANRQKPRTIDSKLSVLKHHLLPRFGAMRLDELTEPDVQRLKADLEGHTAKTVNNILSVLSKMLKVAVDWKVLWALPVRVSFVRVEPGEMEFYEFEEYAKLVAAGELMPDHRALAVLLLGGDAGLRMGEMLALDWDDVDWRRGQLLIKRSESKGYVTSPKSGKHREVPLTKKLTAVLQGMYQEKRTGRVLLRRDGTMSEQSLRTWLNTVQRAAGMEETNALHILRHTFCSHLAMRGAQLLAIKKLAGHASLRTTMQYMHLAPSEARHAIELLDKSRAVKPITNSQTVFRKPRTQSHMSPTGFEKVLATSASNTLTYRGEDSVSVAAEARLVASALVGVQGPESSQSERARTSDSSAAVHPKRRRKKARRKH